MGSCRLPSQLPKLSWHKATPCQKLLNFVPRSFSLFLHPELGCIRGCFAKIPPFNS